MKYQRVRRKAEPDRLNSYILQDQKVQKLRETGVNKVFKETHARKSQQNHQKHQKELYKTTKEKTMND